MALARQLASPALLRIGQVGGHWRQQEALWPKGRQGEPMVASELPPFNKAANSMLAPASVQDGLVKDIPTLRHHRESNRTLAEEERDNRGKGKGLVLAFFNCNIARAKNWPSLFYIFSEISGNKGMVASWGTGDLRTYIGARVPVGCASHLNVPLPQGDLCNCPHTLQDAPIAISVSLHQRGGGGGETGLDC